VYWHCTHYVYWTPTQVPTLISTFITTLISTFITILITTFITILITTFITTLSPLYIHHYSDGTAAGYEGSILFGSAVCNNSKTVTAFVNQDAYEQFVSGGGTAGSFDLVASHLLTTTEHNACYLGDEQLATSACVIVILVATYAYFYVMFKRFLVKVDELRQTSSDYTLVVEDPPADAYTAKEWVDYFSPYGEVVAVTILVDNGDLLERLAKRRHLKVSRLQVQPVQTVL
jgi:hypothetical protein